MNITTPNWVKDAIFYQIFPDRFAKSWRLNKPSNLQPWGATPTTHGFQGGDLLGVVEKLNYLSDLGINAIYLNPIFASAANHRYHTTDYYQVDPILGGNEAFRELLNAAHQRKIRVIIDGVFNHVGRGFFQFNHLMEGGEESPYRDWFEVYNWPIKAYGDEAPNYAAWWGLPALPKLNTNHEAVREFIWDAATYWLKQGVDGWRLDVPNEIDDDAFWREFRSRCKAVNPEAYIVGEIWGNATRWLQGNQFDGVMNYPFTRAAFGFFGGDTLDQSESRQSGLGEMPALTASQFLHTLDQQINHTYAAPIVQSQMNMLTSHDTPRLITIANGRVDTVQLMFLCQMTIPGAPNIYYGDEIGLAGGKDPDCRRAFPWQNESIWRRDLWHYVKEFIKLRQQLPALRYGTFTPLVAENSVVSFLRHYEEQHVLITFNASEQGMTFTLPDNLPTVKECLTANDTKFKAGDVVKMPARQGRIWCSL